MVNQMFINSDAEFTITLLVYQVGEGNCHFRPAISSLILLTFSISWLDHVPATNSYLWSTALVWCNVTVCKQQMISMLNNHLITLLGYAHNLCLQGLHCVKLEMHKMKTHVSTLFMPKLILTLW